MSAHDAHQVGDTSSLSIEVLQEVERVDRAAKRLSLTEKCPHCGQTLPKSPIRNSWPSVKENIENLVEVPLNDEVQSVEEEDKPHRGLRFWLCIVAVIVVGTLSALEGTIIGTALPTIVDDLGSAELYLWTINGYFLTR